MSARIGILNNNVYKSVYLNNTNDFKKLALTFRKNYKKNDLVNDLINNGDINFIGDNLEKTNFFYRDKGDPWEGCVPFEETKINSLEDININSSPVDLYLTFFNNKWYATKAYENNWISITKFIN